MNAYVTDTGVPQLTSTAEIIIDIINTNDNDPVFNSTEYKLNVLENSTKGTIVGTVAANDNDDGMCVFVHLYQYVCMYFYIVMYLRTPANDDDVRGALKLKTLIRR